MGSIRGQTRPLPVTAEIAPDARHIDAKLNAGIHNRFDIEVIDSLTGEVKQTAYAENVICNGLWARLLSGSVSFWSNCIRYGSGSGTPAASDTSLFTDKGYKDHGGDTYSYDVTNSVISVRRKIQLSESEAVGVSITEVGLAYNTTLCTHAMLKDMNGNTISIAKTDTDIINIYATVFLHISAQTPGCYIQVNSKTSLIKWILGASYGISVFTYARIHYSQGWVGGNIFIAGNPIDNADMFKCDMYYGGSQYTSFVPDLTWDPANKKVTAVFKRITASQGNNASGFRRMALVDTDNGINHFTIDVTKALSGSDIVGEAIATGDGTTKNFSTKFSDLTNAKVFIDGAECLSGVTIKPYRLENTDMGQYFIPTAGNAQINVSLTSKYTANTSQQPATEPAIYYNPYYELGIDSFYKPSGVYVYVSNDNVNWSVLSESGGAATITVPTEYKNYKYYKFMRTSASNVTLSAFTSSSSDIALTNIQFDTAPNSGAVITSNYHTAEIAKDINHVFDLTVVMQLGEHIA